MRGGRREPIIKKFDGAIRQMAAQGKKLADIARFVGVDAINVRRYCRQHRIALGELKAPVVNPRHIAIIRAYMENRTASEVGAMFSISRERVRQILHSNGITPRTTKHIVTKTLKPRKKHLTSVERFWLRVDQSGGSDACWPWKGSCHVVNGYGRVRFQNKVQWAHRVAFYLSNRKRATRLVLHACDNPPCCNPAHLRDGTHIDNVRDRDQRHRTDPERRCFRFQRVQVVEIKRSLAAGVPQTELYKLFGCSYAAINNIATGKTWVKVQLENNPQVLGVSA